MLARESEEKQIRFNKFFCREIEKYSIVELLVTVQDEHGPERWVGLALMPLVEDGGIVKNLKPAPILNEQEMDDACRAFETFRREDLLPQPLRSSLIYLVAGSYVKVDQTGSVWLTDLGLDLIVEVIG